MTTDEKVDRYYLIQTLIDELKQLEKGSDKIDRRIGKVLKIDWSPDEDGNWGGYDILPDRCRFTRSLDAAKKLFDKDKIWAIGKRVKASGWVCSIDNYSKSFTGSTAEIAICIAALTFELEKW